MQYIAGFSLFQMNPHLAIAVLNILPINNSSRWEKKKVLNVIQSTWLGFNTNLSVIYRKLESQASFTLNGKCALPSCGWSINNTGGLYSPPVLKHYPILVPMHLGWPGKNIGTLSTSGVHLSELMEGSLEHKSQKPLSSGPPCLCPHSRFYDFLFNCKTKLWNLAPCVEYIVS